MTACSKCEHLLDRGEWLSEKLCGKFPLEFFNPLTGERKPSGFAEISKVNFGDCLLFKPLAPAKENND